MRQRIQHGCSRTSRFLRTRKQAGRILCLVSLLAVFILTPSAANAGGGPENVFLVVNQRSWASRTIANHYISLRDIPANNVFFLDWTGSVERTDLATFRKKILQPILAEIDKRRIGEQIDYVVYSSDFPYEIDFSKQAPAKRSFMSASITSMTYLYELVEANQITSFGIPNNWYANTSTSRGSTIGFENSQAWSAMTKKSTSDDGNNYLLSAMLGYSSGRGNSVDEIVDYLTAAAKVDGRNPKGTVYFMNNEDIRSTTRSPLFRELVQAIKAEGGAAEILDGKTPKAKTDVIGATLGSANYNWKTSRSVFVPGAICDNLTSFGGILREGAGQTPLTEALRHGAAGATGTVVEPYALRAKFPNPSIHLHYRRGCSLAEAVYLSVTAPYQLLLVGDPLCQPYARIPGVDCSGVPADGKVTGTVELTPSIMANPGTKVLRYELYVDGIRRMTTSPGGSMRFDTTGMPDGYHEIRVVAVLNNGLLTRGRKIFPVNVANRGNKIQTRLASPPVVSLNGQISLDVESKNAKRGLVVFSQRQLVAKSDSKRAAMSFSPLRVGMGPHRLSAVALGESNLDNVFATPVTVSVRPGTLLPARPLPVGVDANDGVQVMLANGTTHSVASTKGNWFKEAGITKDQPFSIGGRFSVPRNGVYQFQMQFRGDIDLKIDGKTIFAQKGTKSYDRYEVPVNLQQGGHQMVIKAKLNPPRMMLKFGGKGSQYLAAPTFRH